MLVQQCWKKAWKIVDYRKRDSNPDLYDAGAMLHQLCYQATGNWSLYGSMISLLIVDVCDQMQINKISRFCWPLRCRVWVSFRPEFFRPLFHYRLSNRAKLPRSLTLKLFLSAVQMKLLVVIVFVFLITTESTVVKTLPRFSNAAYA